MKLTKYDFELVMKALIQCGFYRNINTLKRNGLKTKPYTWNEINDLMVKSGASFTDCAKMSNAIEELARKPHYEDLVYESKKVEKMKTLVEAKQFDKIVRARLKTMLEAVVELPDGEQRNVTPEEMEQLKASGVEFNVVQDDINTEVDKETWADEPEQEQSPEAIDNSKDITVDDEEDEEPQNIVDFLTGTSQEVEPNEPAVLNEFGELSNEEKKALLLKLAKDDNDIDAILSAYLAKKLGVNEEDNTEEYAMKNTQDVGSSDDSVITK